MEMIRLNSNFAKVKGVILMVLVVIGGALGNMIIEAEQNFDILKVVIAATIFFVFVIVYVHLEHIDPEVEEIKQRLNPAALVDEFDEDDPIDALDEGPSAPP